MTQKDFADQLHIPQPYLSAIERGLKPADSTAMKACYVFRVPPSFFKVPPVMYNSGSLNFRQLRLTELPNKEDSRVYPRRRPR